MTRAVRHRSDEGMTYDGRSVHAPPGVHEEAIALVLRHAVPGANALDLGAGSGAFTARLRDAGLRTEAVDSDPDGWDVAGVPLQVRDLNAPGWDLPQGAYGVVSAVEVIEHVENPSMFLRNAVELLAPGGVLVVTTPNVVSVASRRAMLGKGELAFFRGGTLFDGGHLTIIPFWLMDDIVQKEGLSIVERAFIGKQPLIGRPGRSWWKRAVVPVADLAIASLARGIPREAAFTSSVAYVLRRPA